MRRPGDGGETVLGNGARVRKDHPKVEALGDLDELNCLLGLLSVHVSPRLRRLVQSIQEDLFCLGADLAGSPSSRPRAPFITSADVARLERETAKLGARLVPSRFLILPGGTQAAALGHLARAVCRRIERRLVSLRGRGLALAYLNRLSSLLFVLARVLNRGGRGDAPWRPRRAG